MKSIKILIALGCFSILTMGSFKTVIPPTATATVLVSVSSKKAYKGAIKVALCKDPETFMDELFLEGVAKPGTDGTISYTFKNVPMGTYAIRVFQDIDGDGKLSSNAFGIPEEPFGFSQNPKIKYGPPSFEQASFDLKNNMSLNVNLLKIEF